MLRRVWLSPICAFLLLAGCAEKAPLAPEPVDESVPQPENQPEATYTPRSTQEARSLLKERGVSYSQSSFLSAAGVGDLEVVRLFVEAGMNIWAQNPDEGNDTALMRAAGGGHLPVVKYLVSQDPGAKTKDSHILLDNGRCAGFLAMELENPNDNCDPQTALMMAAWGGHVEVVEYLTQHRAYLADTGWFDPRNGPDSAFMLAAFAGHLAVVEHLSNNVHPNYEKYLKNFGAMAWASYRGHLPVVRYFFRKGVRLNPGDDLSGNRGNAITQLMFAAWGGRADVVRFLLDNGADMFVMQARWFMDEEGNTWKEFGADALTLAITHGHDQVVQILLDHWIYTHGADGRDDLGRTTLMYAALWGNTQVMQSMIDNGAHVNALTYQGSTALMFAANGGHVEAIRMLLEQGADPTVKNEYGYTATSLAQGDDYAEIIELLNGGA